MDKRTFTFDGELVEVDLDAKLFLREEPDGHTYAYFYLPGWETTNRLPIDAESRPRWEFDGDIYFPTFNPSIRSRHQIYGEAAERVNHVFIRNGKIQYLADCTHEFAGKTLRMPTLREWPEWARYW